MSRWFNILFNIVVGSMAAIGVMNLAVLAIGFGGSPARVLVFVGPLIASGVLYAASGVLLWRSRPLVSAKALIAQAAAVVIGLAYCLIMFGVAGYDPYDEEDRLFIALPAIGVSLVSLQLAYLFAKWLRKDRLRPGEAATADDPQPEKAQLRWYQFSVRTLLKVVLVLSVVVAWLASMANDRRTIEELRELGPATVFYSWGYVETVDLGRMEEKTGEALERLEGLMMLRRLSLGGTKIGDSELEHLKGMTSLTSLELNNTDRSNTRITDAGIECLSELTKLRRLILGNIQVSDDGLKHLVGLTNLRELALRNTQITDTGLVHLKGLTHLQELSLDRTQVTDAGLEHLKGFAELRRLSLNSTQVTDAGLEHLTGLANLTSVQFIGTQVTEEGAKKLRQALPKCHDLAYDRRR